eukprot:SAG22_NODE_103_length_20175_cov_15.280833_8_plen_131_part_00
MVVVAPQLNSAFSQFKDVADAKSDVTDADIEAIMSDSLMVEAEDTWSLESVYLTSGNTLTPSATVTLESEDGGTHTDSAIGVGAVDAVVQAIQRVVGTPFLVDNFTVQVREEPCCSCLPAGHPPHCTACC